MKPRVFLALGLSVLLPAAGCSANSSADSGAEARANEDADAGAGGRRGYARGQIIIITGIASDLANQPIPDLEVVLEASRQSFDYLRFRKRRPVVRKAATTTSTDGSFEIQWPWDKGFNRHSLVFGITVAEPGGDGFHVLHRVDLSRRIGHGSPVVSSVQIEDTSFLDSFLEFRTDLDGEAQSKVYRELGKPDKVRERISADGTAIDWWYFELGKVYRFRDRELLEIENFEPVKPFDS